jgi:hypothetical protein
MLFLTLVGWSYAVSSANEIFKECGLQSALLEYKKANLYCTKGQVYPLSFLFGRHLALCPMFSGGGHDMIEPNTLVHSY